MGYTVGGPPSNLLSTPRILTTLLHNLLVLLAWVKFMRQSQFSSQSKKLFDGKVFFKITFNSFVHVSNNVDRLFYLQKIKIHIEFILIEKMYVSCSVCILKKINILLAFFTFLILLIVMIKKFLQNLSQIICLIISVL